MAFKYYKMAADIGKDPQAQFVTGLSYANGAGIEEDKNIAFGYYKLAAEQGFAGGQYALGSFSFLSLHPNRDTSSSPLFDPRTCVIILSTG